MLQFLAQEPQFWCLPQKETIQKKTSKEELGDQGWKTCDLMK
jgi:hypothetical protein